MTTFYAIFFVGSVIFYTMFYHCLLLYLGFCELEHYQQEALLLLRDVTAHLSIEIFSGSSQLLL